MNLNSLAHSAVINQQQQTVSWIDDPFDLKGSFIEMDLNPKNKKDLSDYAHELISNYGSYNYNQCDINLSDIPDDEQNELVRLYIESTGRDLIECVNGNDFSIENDYTCALLAMLQNDCTETRERFAQVTRNNILTYYKEALEELLVNECNNFLHTLNNEQDSYAKTDYEHGDIVWSKF